MLQLILLLSAIAKAQKERFAYLGDSILIEYYSRKKPCGMTLIGSPFFKYGVGFALRKGHRLTEKMSRKVVTSLFIYSVTFL